MNDANMQDNSELPQNRRQHSKYLNRKERRRLAKRGKLFKDPSGRAWQIANQRMKKHNEGGKRVMSFYEDYVAEGLACSSCGQFFFDDDEPGFPRECDECEKVSLGI